MTVIFARKVWRRGDWQVAPTNDRPWHHDWTRANMVVIPAKAGTCPSFGLRAHLHHGQAPAFAGVTNDGMGHA